ncbi:zinc finger protein 629 [Salmo salar]|uniref:Zinc finger protein 629-like n=1 Tax=Salmo salar TaxID=8030 RepID=A0A1S3RSW4_SALSA|nr:zinc finger protein 629 [Salmo salar]XP_014055401.1 zinc finger protein 629 [Salmo salar]XP_014055402.1 zinc finger protein 629 [Salmo salar]|eukprot:XP_014055400.1 PREDICTED: zinc finger protein 629-like [Salmo salar]
MSEAILTFQYQLSGVMETVLKTAVHEITRLVKEGFLEEVTRSKQEADVLRKKLQQWEQKWRDSEEERKRREVEEKEQRKKREAREQMGICVSCSCAGDTEKGEALSGAEEGCVIKQEEMFQSEGPNTLPEREGPQETNMSSSSCVSERMEEREAHVVHIKQEPDDWGDLVSQMVTSTDTTIMSLSRLQRLSSHAGAWTSEPQPPLPAPWAREPLPPAPWAREPPPLPPEPTPWTREKQHLLPGSGIPTQATECAVGALESSPYGLSNNTTAQLGVKPYSCPHCEKSFPQLRNLKDHQKYHHTGKKAFTCSQCGKGFVYMCHLRVHMQCHTGERPFSCSQCGKSFVYLCNLKSHQQYHTGEKPYSCSQCGKSFSLQSGLKKHRVIHSAERPYHCTNCGNRFYSRADLKRHEQIHAAR